MANKSIKNGMMLWTDAYLADTGHLTTLEHGAYMLILMAMWRSPNGRIKGDRITLSRTAKMTLDKWRHVEKTIMALLLPDGDFVSQKRLLQEREIALCKSEKRRLAAGARYGAKPLKDMNVAHANAPVLHMQTEAFADAPNPNPNPASKKERKVGRAKSANHPIPEDFALSDDLKRYAVSKGFTVPQAESEFIKFRRHHIGHKSKWSRWDLAWHTWVENEVKWAAERQQRYRKGSVKEERMQRNADIERALEAAVLRERNRVVPAPIQALSGLNQDRRLNGGNS